MSQTLNKLNSLKSEPPELTNTAPPTRFPASGPDHSNRRKRFARLFPFLSIFILVLGSLLGYRLYKKRTPTLPIQTNAESLLAEELNMKHTSALKALEEKRYEDAVKDFTAIVEKLPQELSPQINLAYAYKRKGEFKQAEEILVKSLKQDPTNRVAQNNLGVLYIDIQELEKAESALLQAYNLDPRHLDTLLNLAFLFEMKKDWVQAEKYYQLYRKNQQGDFAYKKELNERLRKIHSLSFTQERAS